MAESKELNDIIRILSVFSFLSSFYSDCWLCLQSDTLGIPGETDSWKLQAYNLHLEVKRKRNFLSCSLPLSCFPCSLPLFYYIMEGSGWPYSIMWTYNTQTKCSKGQAWDLWPSLSTTGNGTDRPAGTIRNRRAVPSAKQAARQMPTAGKH